MSGMYEDGASSEEQSLFVSERHCFSDLVSGLTSPCRCGATRLWKVESVIQVCVIQIMIMYPHIIILILERARSTSSTGVSALFCETNMV